jgi:hypothetical protein
MSSGLIPPAYDLLVTALSLTYITAERTWTYCKHISRDRYPGNLLARRSDLQKTTYSTVACWTVFTELLPGNALIKSVTILNTRRWRFQFACFFYFHCYFRHVPLLRCFVPSRAPLVEFLSLAIFCILLSPIPLYHQCRYTEARTPFWRPSRLHSNPWPCERWHSIRRPISVVSHYQALHCFPLFTIFYNSIIYPQVSPNTSPKAHFFLLMAFWVDTR